MNTKIKAIGILVFSVLILAAFTNINQDPTWIAPEKYQKMKNPYEANSESLKIGKSIYNKHCKSCHGSEGLGDGPKAAQLDTPSGDFSLDEFHNQSDGTLFYKSKFGRGDMPNYEKKIPYDEDIWHTVNYMRTFQ